MQEEQRTSDPDADLVLPPEAESEPAPAPVTAAFDPDALEDAASLFRPSWEEVAVPGEAPAPAMVVVPAPAPTESLRLPEAELDVHASNIMNVVVPRAPRTPQVDYGQHGADTEDDFGLSAASLPTTPMRLWWIAAAAFLVVATAGLLMMRGGSAAKDRAELKSTDESAEPAAVNTAAPEAPTPVAPAAVQAPAAPPAQAQPEVKAPEPVAAPAVVERVVPVARPEPAIAATRANSRHSERRAQASRAKAPPVLDRRTPAKSASSRSGSKTQRRGAGFVSTNPY